MNKPSLLWIMKNGTNTWTELNQSPIRYQQMIFELQIPSLKVLNDVNLDQLSSTSRF